ncbi:MAG: ABC transporter permease [Cyanosarcina radialis HA8281-LM2]|jgi:peptide/nickel transport system permease protein|nr:ABC transporter permease [Cyanosarcina radialis HA8281-LM2]
MTTLKKSLPRIFRFSQSPSLSIVLLVIGLLITVIFVAIAIFAPVMQSWGWLQNPLESLSNPRLQPPSGEHWFGTTSEGYDVFSRTVFGSQAALQVVLMATVLSLIVGVPLGMVSGYLGGRVDQVLLFLMDAIYTLPRLLLSMTLAFVVGRGVFNAAIAVSIPYIAKYYRVVRNHTASVKNEVFIEAAQAMGASTGRVLWRYLFLNVIQNVPVLFTLNAADAILTLSGLGFLGLGLPEDTPEWGRSLKDALSDLQLDLNPVTGEEGTFWWTTLFPGLALTLMVVGLSLLGEGLSELIDPRSRKENQ